MRALDPAPCALALRRSRAAYAGELFRRPPALAAAVTAVVASVASGTLIGVPVVLVALAATVAAASHGGVQRRLDRERERRARRERREARETALEEAGVRGRRLAVLTELADAVAARAPEDSRVDLEPMLDRYVAVAIALERCHQVMDAADLLTGKVTRCREHGTALREELALIEEHILLLAEQAALASSESLVTACVPPGVIDDPQVAK